MQEERSAPGNRAIRHIIRFRNPAIYHSCLKAFSRKAGLEIQPLPFIQGLALPPSCLPLLRRYARHYSKEPDRLLQVESAQALLPLPVHSPPKAYDASQRIPWGVRKIGAPRVWRRSKGARIRIGVIDTGADFRHPDLRDRLARGINLLQRFTLPSDDNGHGTHIIGTIAAANPDQGILGVAPQAEIYPVKAFDRNGTAYISDIIMGIQWCVANGMDIINMSFGMRGKSEALLEAVRQANRAGVMVVASCGNDGRRGQVDYPARFPQTISVGATQRDGKIAPFSNRSKSVDIYAPGENIYSTWLDGQYQELSGTSMATSHVTGVLALLLALRPGLSPKQAKALIMRSASGLPHADGTSRGLISAVNALRAMRRLAPRKRRAALKRTGAASRPKAKANRRGSRGGSRQAG